MRALYGESDSDSDSRWNWNVVQNNGISAAQQVPHVHFHVIPRPAANAEPGAAKMSFVMFGRGQRDELDDEEGAKLAGLLRQELAREVQQVKQQDGVDLEVDEKTMLGKL
ncbi:hypothetical protein EYZ11_001561 [Aspergillus tanneri]|nr:hypothetical protein EYZ11_001561 [Aspergillus tanneri]